MATQAAAKPATQVAPMVSRMTLASVMSGSDDGPFRLMLHGVDGVGKSSFAAMSPKPIFLDKEDGSERLGVKRFPEPESWQDVLDAIRVLITGEHDYKTFVVDSVDWIEPLLWRHLCQKYSVVTIEEIGGGYGKGYQAALDEWRIFVAEMERLQRERKMNVILIAHSQVKQFKDPRLAEGFDRFVIKINDKAAAVLREWCKGVYFANYETFAVKEKKHTRGVSTGARLLYTQYSAAYDAKDRYGLPEQLPLSFEDFDQARRVGAPANTADLRAEIARKATELGGDIEKLTADFVAKAGDDGAKLAQINNRLNAKLAEKVTQ